MKGEQTRRAWCTGLALAAVGIVVAGCSGGDDYVTADQGATDERVNTTEVALRLGNSWDQTTHEDRVTLCTEMMPEEIADMGRDFIFGNGGDAPWDHDTVVEFFDEQCMIIDPQSHDVADLYELCEDGEMAACDSLWAVAPSGSAEEAFGDTCAGTHPAGAVFCESLDD